MTEGGHEAVRADDDVVPAADMRRLEERVRELERLLGRKTMEVEILKKALDLTRSKNVWPAPSARVLRRDLISLRQRIRSQSNAALAKMEIRASWSS